MPKQQGFFDDLIPLLEDAKRPNDLNELLFNKLMNATLLTGITYGTNACDMSPKDALLFAKNAINKHIDSVINKMPD
jgi:hypothetical protein